MTKTVCYAAFCHSTNNMYENPRLHFRAYRDRSPRWGQGAVPRPPLPLPGDQGVWQLHPRILPWAQRVWQLLQGAGQAYPSTLGPAFFRTEKFQVFVYFLAYFGHSFAYVAHFVLLGDVYSRIPRAASRCANNLATHLPKLATHLPTYPLISLLSHLRIYFVFLQGEVSWPKYCNINKSKHF